VLLVTRADLVGLWHARTALSQLEHQLGIGRERTSLVINRHDARYHHARDEIAWHLGVEVAAVIPHDHAAMQRAIADQRPVVLERGSRAARAMLALAERICHGTIRLEPEPARARRRGVRWWQRLVPSSLPPLLPGPKRQVARAPEVSAPAGVGHRPREQSWL
jgi:Flp pilus assembly CpaE family ATPase